MNPSLDFCKVNEEGLAHLFEGMDYGAVCACGRKFIGLAADNEQFRLGDSPWDAGLRLVRCADRHRVPYQPEMWRTDVLLARGAREIRRAHAARVSAGARSRRAGTTTRQTERLLQDVVAGRSRRREARQRDLSHSGPRD